MRMPAPPVFICAWLVMTACVSSTNTDKETISMTAAQPPIAERHPETLVSPHGDERVDEYYWLRDDSRESEKVLAYLKAENEYTRAVLEPTEALQAELFAEMRDRLDPDDATVPVRYRNYWYQRRYREGEEYPLYTRRRGSIDGPEAIILDVPDLAEGHDYYSVGGMEVSQNDQLLAYAEDIVSRRKYRIRVKNLQTGETLPELIEHTSGSLAWSDDNQTLYYVKRQKDTLIANQLWRHTLGTPVEDDELIFEETDPAYSMYVYRSRDKQHIVVHLGSTLQSETRLIPAGDAEAETTAFLPRESEHEYSIEPLGDVAYILTNWQAKNFRVMRAPLSSSADKSTWEEVIGHRDEVFIGDMQVFDDYLVVEETENANVRLHVYPLDGSGDFHIESEEPAFSMALESNPNTDTSILRYSYSSLTTPTTIFDLDLDTGRRVVRKVAFAGHDFDRDRYQTTRLQIEARDGESLPVTLLHRAGAEADGSHPVYLLGYGAYGSWYEPGFNRNMLSLVDRGFVFAIAHIRGGQEHGRRWYEDGKLFSKKNTFTDFIDIAEGLKSNGWAAQDALVGSGRSAGGLLIGAVANMAPATFDALVTEVPFVDVITTMLDESIPLTTFEYDEWGDPREKDAYQYMLSYSPYDQVSARDYPPMYISTGLWDSQVQYWEPAKWVARLRHRKTDDNPLLLYTDMSAGHGGGSGRFDRLRDRAREFAFIIQTLKSGEARNKEQGRTER